MIRKIHVFAVWFRDWVTFQMVQGGFFKRKNSTVLLVLGMHRSGTSAVSGALSKLDLRIGADLIKPMPENPKGFFEDVEVVSFNNQILRSINSSWYDTDSIDFTTLRSVDYMGIWSLIIKKTKNNSILLLKDPRFCLLLPLYLKVFSSMNIQVKGIIVERDCSEVIRSLNKRGAVPGNPDFNLLFHKYKNALKQHSKGVDVYSVTFTEVLSNPLILVDCVQKLLPTLRITENEENELIRFIDPSLRNHV